MGPEPGRRGGAAGRRKEDQQEAAFQGSLGSARAGRTAGALAADPGPPGAARGAV